MNKRDRILECAESLLTRKGISAVTMDMIAEATPASKMTIYKYFSDKRTLVEAVVDRLIDRAVGKVKDTVAQSASAEDAFRKLLDNESQAELGLSDEFLVDLMNNHPDSAARMMIRGREGVYPVIEELIFRAQRDGYIRRDLSPHVIVLYMYAVKEFLSRPGTMPTVIDLKALAEQVRTIFLHGILTDR